MRTSYKRGSERKNEDLVQESLKKENSNLEQLQSAYLEIAASVAEEREREEVQGVSEALSNMAEKDLGWGDSKSKAKGVARDQPVRSDSGVVGKEKPAKQEKKKKHRKPWLWVTLVLIILLIVGVGVYYFVVVRGNEAVERELDGIEERISGLYTSSAKDEIASGITQEDVDSLYMELINVQSKGALVDSDMSELETIGYYLSDMEVLDRFNDPMYNLTTGGMIESIDNIRSHTEDYVVPGLASSVNTYATEIKDDYEYFVNLRSDLNAVVDPVNFDEVGYQSRIEMVKHIPNRTELDGIFDLILADRQAAIAQQNLQAAQDEQAQAEAQRQLEEAQELQRKTQQELDDVRRQLEEATQKESSTSDVVPESVNETENVSETENAVGTAVTDLDLEESAVED